MPVKVAKRLKSSLLSMMPCCFSSVATSPKESPSATTTVAVRGSLFRASTSLAATQQMQASTKETAMTRMA